jgi:hypothetical protein
MEVLRVRIGEAGAASPMLREVQEVLEHLRKVLATLCSELGGAARPPAFRGRGSRQRAA